MWHPERWRRELTFGFFCSQKTFGPINKAIVEIFKTLSAHFEQTNKILSELGKQLYESYTEKIQPTLKQTLDSVETLLRGIYEELYNIAITWAEKLHERLKTVDLSELNKSVSKLAGQVTKIVGAYVEVIAKEAEEIYKLLVDAAQSLPGLDAIKDKLKEIYNTALPNFVSIKAFGAFQLGGTHDLSLQDLETSLKELWTKLVKELKSYSRWIPVDWNDLSGANALWGLPVPSYVQRLATIPPWTGVRFSVWNFLRNERLPSLQELIYANGPIDLTSIVPPYNKHAQIVDGTQIFTFNGNQLTLEGNCQYVLAQDVVDGNFTIVAQIAEKKLKSISIVDKSGESVQASSDGKVLKNNKPADFPVLGTELYAWRSFHSIHLLSLAGVRVHCSVNLSPCHVVVSGYYHNKLRGVLGNANGEPKGDLQLPNAKWADNLSGFVNAYKLQPSCADIQIPARHDHATQDDKSAECDVVFGSTSSLRYCALLIDPTEYQLACNHAAKTSATKQQTACSIGIGYATLCRLHGVPISMPSKCQRCSSVDEAGAKKSYEVGERYNVNAPQKKADVILVVDRAIEPTLLTEIVQTTIDDLRRELKARSITDVNIAAIGYKKGDAYSHLYTSEGQLNIRKFHLAKQEKESDLLKDNSITPIGCEHIDPALKRLEELRLRLQDDLNLSADAKAFREAVEAPLRGNAGKVIIAIRSDPLEKSSNPVSVHSKKLRSSSSLNLLAVLS